MKELTLYEQRIQNRSFLRYLVGLLVRWHNYRKIKKNVIIARKNGATIGDEVVMPRDLAKRANKNLIIGNHVSIQSSNIDLRSPVIIGNNVIIGSGVQIITASHDVDSREWTYKSYGLVIEDYTWIATNVLILPSCRRIAYGSVIGAGAVLAKNTDSMDIVSGNPAVFLRKRKCVHTSLVVEHLLGGDYNAYKKAWKDRNK